MVWLAAPTFWPAGDLDRWDLRAHAPPSLTVGAFGEEDFDIAHSTNEIKMAEKTALIVGISGCSSSGKTTLARLLRDIFPNTFILHEDDFYRPEPE